MTTTTKNNQVATIDEWHFNNWTKGVKDCKSEIADYAADVALGGYKDENYEWKMEALFDALEQVKAELYEVEVETLTEIARVLDGLEIGESLKIETEQLVKLVVYGDLRILAGYCGPDAKMRRTVEDDDKVFTPDNEKGSLTITRVS